MKRWFPSRESLTRSRWLAPLAQFLFAVAFAVWLRGHIAVAAAATLVTNPLTFAPLYWLAHRIGSALLGRSRAQAQADAAIVEAQVQATAATQGWLSATWEAMLSAGAPLVVGLAVMAIAGALLGFALVWLLWRPRAKGAPDAG